MMASKYEKIIDYLIKIERKLGNIDGHLVELNGKVNMNVNNIEINRQDIGKIKNKLAYFMGSLAMALVALQLILKYFV